MQDSVSLSQSQSEDAQSLAFSEPTQTHDFKIKVCLPYFKDIYKDLCSRSDDKSKGINKISFLEYCQLPGLLAERLFAVLDVDRDNYLNSKEFLTGLLRIYCSQFDQKIKFVFDIYDFDNDSFITKTDITTIITCMPVVRRSSAAPREGKFTQEGGGATTFQERVNSLEEMTQVLDLSFGERTMINFEEFSAISEEKTSDMVLSVLSLLRERLPCSENYWRYKRNYEMHMKILAGDQQAADSSDVQFSSKNSEQRPNMDEECKSEGNNGVKKLAKAHMSFIKPLSPYNQNENGFFRMQGQSEGSENNSRPGSPENAPAGDVPMSEEEVANNIPLSNLKSNQVGQREVYIDMNAQMIEQQMSPGVGQRFDFQITYCICGLPCTPGTDSCDSCEGKNSVHHEGEILKKQKRGGSLKKYWFVLLGKELYSYKNQSDLKHKEMKSLAGVYLKEELEEFTENGTSLYPFMLIFPNKRRIYYLSSQDEKDKWISAIKRATGYASLHDYYELGENLGKGKYGLVKAAVHKVSGDKKAVKIIKKKELQLRDLELLKREIEVLKVCQHPNIIKFFDVFENQDSIYIVMEVLDGGDFFSFLHKRKFIISEELARSIAHQLATAIYYLHSFGIAHRDLKPENILMVDKTDTSEIKLVDFGLSRTFGPGETCREPYGTLCYVAPEILLQQPYDKSVDCWSLGIIIYLMLGRHLPFDSQDDKQIGRKTIYQEISFNHPVWSNVSANGKDLISKLLIKNRDERMTIDKVLEHPWILGDDQKITMLRRKSADMGDKVLQFVAYSNTNMERIQQNSPKNAQQSQNVLAGNVNPNPGTFDAPSLANALSGTPKPGGFQARMQAKPKGAAGMGGGASGGGGLFKKYQFGNDQKPAGSGNEDQEMQ